VHESGMIEELIAKVEEAARKHSARRATAVEVSIGELAAISAEHLREHFLLASKGTLAEGAELRVRDAQAGPPRDPFGVYLESVELET